MKSWKTGGCDRLRGFQEEGRHSSRGSAAAQQQPRQAAVNPQSSSQEILCSLTKCRLWSWSLQSVSGSCDWQLSMMNATRARVVAVHKSAGLLTASSMHLTCLNWLEARGNCKIPAVQVPKWVYLNVLLGLRMYHHSWLLLTGILGPNSGSYACMAGKHFIKWATFSALHYDFYKGGGGRAQGALTYQRLLQEKE